MEARWSASPSIGVVVEVKSRSTWISGDCEVPEVVQALS